MQRLPKILLNSLEISGECHWSQLLPLLCQRYFLTVLDRLVSFQFYFLPNSARSRAFWSTSLSLDRLIKRSRQDDFTTDYALARQSTLRRLPAGWSDPKGFNNAAVPYADDMTFVHTVMRNCDINRRVPLAKTKDVRQRSLWHCMHYRHLCGGILR